MSLDKEYKPPTEKKTCQKILLCLREDKESILSEKEKRDLVQSLPYDCRRYDTTLKKPIYKRERTLENTLKMFNKYDLVITDRYHGLIFSVLCKKPCIVIPTVDHKLTSAINWFKDIPTVSLIKDLNDIPKEIKKITANNQNILSLECQIFDHSKQLKNYNNKKEYKQKTVQFTPTCMAG